MLFVENIPFVVFFNTNGNIHEHPFIYKAALVGSFATFSVDSAGACGRCFFNACRQAQQPGYDARAARSATPEKVVENAAPAKTEGEAPKATNNGKTQPVVDAHPVDVFELPDIEVVGNTPLGTTGLELKKIPGNVQSAEDEEIHRHEAFGLTDFMNRRLESVNINDTQNNPYQPDITYRGFNASPLLGTPIGISVYQDGVRVNEPFGDTVNWDLIPQIAISSMEMMPGSNPLFGLNTLGGALSVRTKSGFSHPGFNAQANGGSYGRQAYQAEYGGSKGQFRLVLSRQYFP